MLWGRSKKEDFKKEEIPEFPELPSVPDELAIQVPAQFSEELPAEFPAESNERLPVPVGSAPVVKEPRQIPGIFFVSKKDNETILSDVSRAVQVLKQLEPELGLTKEVDVKEYSKLDEISSYLEDIERKLLYMDNLLFGR